MRFELLAEQIEQTPIGSQMFDGLVTIEEAFGHTPGHAMYRIASAGETLLNFTDIAHSDILMFRNPAWVIGWDHDMGQPLKRAAASSSKSLSNERPASDFMFLGRALVA